MTFPKNRQKKLERILAVFLACVAIGVLLLIVWPREPVKAVPEPVCEYACCCRPKVTYCSDYEDYSK